MRAELTAHTQQLAQSALVLREKDTLLQELTRLCRVYKDELDDARARVKQLSVGRHEVDFQTGATAKTKAVLMPVTGDVAMMPAPIQSVGVHQAAPVLQMRHGTSRSRQLQALSAQTAQARARTAGAGGAAATAARRTTSAPTALGASQSVGKLPSPAVVQDYVRQSMHRAMIQA